MIVSEGNGPWKAPSPLFSPRKQWANVTESENFQQEIEQKYFFLWQVSSRAEINFVYKIPADLETGFFPNCWLLQDKSNCLARGYELSGVWCPEEKMNLRGQLTSASVCLSVYFSPTRPGFHSNILHLGNISRLPSSNFLPRSISQRGKVSKVLHLRAFWPPPTPVLHLSHLES